VQSASAVTGSSTGWGEVDVNLGSSAIGSLFLLSGSGSVLMGMNDGSIQGIIDPDHLALLVFLRLQLLEDAFPSTLFLPALQPIMTGRTRWIAIR
jgi:hypothetical protein